MDVSITLMKELQSTQASEQFFQDPPVPVTAIESALEKLTNTLKSAGLSYILVFDGCRHPLKGKTNEKRSAAREEAKSEMARLLQEENPSNYERIRKLRQRCTFIRPDIIALAKGWCDRSLVRHIASPFEADWQMALLQRQGIVLGIISEDSDLFVLGCDNILMDLSIADNTCILVKRSTIKAYLTEELELTSGITDDQIHEFAAFLGSDYIDNLKGFGEKTVKKYMAKWFTLDFNHKVEALELFQTTKKWSGGDPCPHYKDDFLHCINAWRYAPAWEIVPSEGHNACDAYNAGDFDVRMVSLRQVDPGIDIQVLLGFTPIDRFEETNSDPNARPLDYFNLRYYAQTGEVLEPLVPPVDDQGRTLPWGSYMSDSVPLTAQPMSALASWLSARKIPVRSTDSREDLLTVVKEIYEFQRRSGRLDLPRIHPLEPFQGVGHYINWETLTCNQTIEWKGGDYMMGTIRADILLITDDMVDEVFGPGQPALREKAKVKVKSGHYDMATLQLGAALLDEGVPDTPSRVIVIACMVAASYKSDVYRVLLVFRTEDKKFVGFPTSRCQCKNGRVFCSHMLGMLFVIAMIQKFKNVTFQELVDIMPDPIQTLRGLLMPLSYAIRYN